MYQYWGWLVPSLSNSQMCTYILLLSKLNLVCLWVNQCEKIDLGQLTISGWGQSEEVLI